MLANAPGPSIASQGGDPASGEKEAAHIVEAVYLNSYVAHAPMDTHTALATVEGQKVMPEFFSWEYLPYARGKLASLTN